MDTEFGKEEDGGMDNREMLQAQMMSKNVGIAAILTFFFGGLGLLYVSIIAGLIATVIEIVIFIVGFFTVGIGWLIFIPWHIFCIILAVVMTNSHNKRLLGKIDARASSTNEITGS
jgi:hypothetical protein